MDMSDFLPHGFCYLWNPQILWLHVLSDSLIAIAYFSIPAALVYIVLRRRDIPFNFIFWMFSLFILGCGATHLMDVVTIWKPWYLASGVIKALTAAVSIVTVFKLVPLIPRAGTLSRTEQIHAVNVQLTSRAAELENTERELRATLVSRESAIAELTDRISALEALKQALKEIEDLKFAIDEHAIVASTDVQGKITYVNDKFCSISKYSREELLGRDHRILNSGHHSKEFFKRMYETICRGEVWHGEMRNLAKDGSIYWVDATIVPFLKADGKPRQYIAIRTDITDRKRAEQKIRELNDELEARVVERTKQLAAANQELEAFTYSVSHDLRAPLRHITGFAAILEEDFSACLAPEAQQHLSRVLEGARKMVVLIDSMLDLARLGRQPAKFHAVDLNRLVEDAVALLAPELDGRSIEWKIGKLPSVEGDPVLIRQVFQNLLANSIKFTRTREAAVIEVDQVSEGDSKCVGQVTIFVRDNGVGFNMKYADKLFKALQRLHSPKQFEGTGIGLATVHRIIEKHGGKVWTEAVLDQGATFYFSLSRSQSSDPQTKMASAGDAQ